MTKFNEIMNDAVKKWKVLRQQAEKDVKAENIEAIMEYFGNNAGLEKVVNSFGVSLSTLSADDANGLLCILAEANKEWDEAPCDEEGPTPEQDKNLDNILMDAACDIICYFHNINTAKL